MLFIWNFLCQFRNSCGFEIQFIDNNSHTTSNEQDVLMKDDMTSDEEKQQGNQTADSITADKKLQVSETTQKLLK